MRSEPKTNILKEWLRSIVESDPSITLRKPKATAVAARGVTVSHQLILAVLKTPVCGRKKQPYFTHSHLAPISKLRQRFWKVTIGMKHKDVGLSFSSRCDVIRTKRSERRGVFGEQGLSSTSVRTRRELGYQHLF